ncbi:MAG: hypothetical protein ABSC23_07645 [Bryobacteraceae bacterium]
MQRLAIEFGDQPSHRSASSRFLQPRNLLAAHASFAALQLDKPYVQEVRVFSTKLEGDSVDNSGSRSAGLACKECDLPTVFLAVRFQGIFACGFGGMGFFPRTHPLARLPHFPRSRAPLSGSRRLLPRR